LKNDILIEVDEIIHPDYIESLHVYIDSILRMTQQNVGISGLILEKVKTAEVGNIFNFGTQKSEDTDFKFTAESGKQEFVYLGSYGIGITRVMGVLVEKFADERGIVWPKAVAPFSVYLAAIGESEEVKNAANSIYDDLTKAGVEIFYDDRDVRPGEKFADADLIGIPIRLVVSEKTLAGEEVEFKKRTDSNIEMVKLVDIIERIKSN
jgi:prolyl-tRNA synthetase